MSCGQAHSSARELVAQGKEAKRVAETLQISRSSFYNLASLSAWNSVPEWETIYFRNRCFG